MPRNARAVQAAARAAAQAAAKAGAKDAEEESDLHLAGASDSDGESQGEPRRKKKGGRTFSALRRNTMKLLREALKLGATRPSKQRSLKHIKKCWFEAAREQGLVHCPFPRWQQGGVKAFDSFRDKIIEGALLLQFGLCQGNKKKKAVPSLVSRQVQSVVAALRKVDASVLPVLLESIQKMGKTEKVALLSAGTSGGAITINKEYHQMPVVDGKRTGTQETISALRHCFSNLWKSVQNYTNRGYDYVDEDGATVDLNSKTVAAHRNKLRLLQENITQPDDERALQPDDESDDDSDDGRAFQ